MPVPKVSVIRTFCQAFFLTDLFEKLNILKKSLQGNNTNILNLEDKVGGFKKKLDL